MSYKSYKTFQTHGSNEYMLSRFNIFNTSLLLPFVKIMFQEEYVHPVAKWLFMTINKSIILMRVRVEKGTRLMSIEAQGCT